MSLFGGLCPILILAQQSGTDDRFNVLKNPSIHYDNRVDNMLYWNYALRKGYVEAYREKGVLPSARYKGSHIITPLFVLQDSPDVCVVEGNIMQSENSLTTHPANFEKLLNSNNSSDFPVTGLFGADAFKSEDGGESWEGEIYGAGGDNSGDPAVAINAQGRMFVGYINENFGQSVSYSDDNGQTWIKILVSPSPGYYPASLDKNHLWIDNSPLSPYNGNVYASWTRFSAGGANDGEIQFARSVSQGTTWSYPLVISQGVTAGSHNQGVNIQTGPEGQVYVVWAIYDNWPADENALGFAASFDGGLTFQPASRIINNIRGIRYSETFKNLRVNSFPSMTVDLSNSPRRGTIYVVWANRGIPGINTGSDIDVYLIKSADQGNTWSQPIRVNQDLLGAGKQHFFPWISCDPVTGNLSVIFYDDRECAYNECETWVAYSTDGGDTWQDFRVSDIAFTPQPIPGLAANYFGDYLGITSHNLKIYPIWTDNRSGKALTYVSPINSTPAPNQPYVIHQDHIFRNVNGSQVDLLSFGDSVSVDLTAINIGDQPANDVLITLTSPSGHLIISDSTQYYGNFNPQQSVSVNHAFKLNISDTIPDNERIKFIVKAASADTTWTSQFYAWSSAPDLQITGFLINDFGGNGNRIPDAGENAITSFILSNKGDFLCDTIVSYFSSSKDWVDLMDSIQKFPPLYPGQTDTIHYRVRFSDSLPYGISLNFNLKCQSGRYQRNKSFIRRSGLRVEDWESNSFAKYPWKRTGNSPWLISTKSYEGHYSARSGIISDGGSTILSLTYDIIQPDSVSFWFKVSSESNYDFFSFFVDNVLYGKWSGIRDWQKAAYWVQSGRHTLRWQYEKDIYLSMGDDAVWLDYIALPIFAIPQANTGNVVNICAKDDSVYVTAQAANFTYFYWTTTGDGFFRDSASLNTLYFLGDAEKSIGRATLLFHVVNEMAVTVDTLIIKILPDPLPPIAVSVTPDSLCFGSLAEIHLHAQPADPGDDIFWYKNSCDGEAMGSGYNLNVPAPDQTLSYFARSGNMCNVSDCVSTTAIVHPNPQLELGPDSIYCSGEVVVLDGGNFASYDWEPFFADRFLILDTNLIPSGSQQTIFLSVLDSLGCLASDSIIIGFTKCAPGIQSNVHQSFSIYPNPNDGQFFLTWSHELLADILIELLDIHGRVLFHRIQSQSTSPQIMQFKSFSLAGLYLLKLTSNGRVWVLPVNILATGE